MRSCSSTGANAAGYTLTQVVVNSEDSAGDDFDVEVCEADTTANEFPSHHDLHGPDGAGELRGRESCISRTPASPSRRTPTTWW